MIATHLLEATSVFALMNAGSGVGGLKGWPKTPPPKVILLQVLNSKIYPCRVNSIEKNSKCHCYPQFPEFQESRGLAF